MLDVFGVPTTVKWSSGVSLSLPLSQAQLLSTLAVNDPPLTMIPIVALTALGLPFSLSPVVIALKMPPLKVTLAEVAAGGNGGGSTCNHYYVVTLDATSSISCNIDVEYTIVNP